MKKDDPRRSESVAKDSVPFDIGTGALAAVSALMDERAQYEKWIAALDARRAATPPHVFERVHADYAMRLDAVIAQLKQHADGLRTGMDGILARLAALRDQRQQAEDARAEAELRAHVGELSDADWVSMAASSDAGLASLAARTSAMEQDLVRTRQFLDAAERPAGTAATEARAVDRVPTPRVSVERPAPEPPRQLSPAVSAAEQQLLDIEERPSRPSGSVPAAATAPPAEPAPRSNKFDELAFLSSVVDTPAGAIEPAPADLPDEKTRRDTFALRSHEDQIVNLDESHHTPPGLPVAAHQGAPTDGVKTLRCGECGAMNYPTEWYCERCGAELASL